jgi:hypothetical protein
MGFTLKKECSQQAFISAHNVMRKYGLAQIYVGLMHSLRNQLQCIYEQKEIKLPGNGIVKLTEIHPNI